MSETRLNILAVRLEMGLSVDQPTFWGHCPTVLDGVNSSEAPCSSGWALRYLPYPFVCVNADGPAGSAYGSVEGPSFRTGQSRGILSILVPSLSFEHFRSECIKRGPTDFLKHQWRRPRCGSQLASRSFSLSPSPSLKTSPLSLRHFPGNSNQPLAVINLVILTILSTRRRVPLLDHQRPPSLRDRHCTESPNTLDSPSVCQAPNSPQPGRASPFLPYIAGCT